MNCKCIHKPLQVFHNYQKYPILKLVNRIGRSLFTNNMVHIIRIKIGHDYICETKESFNKHFVDKQVVRDNLLKEILDG